MTGMGTCGSTYVDSFRHPGVRAAAYTDFSKPGPGALCIRKAASNATCDISFLLMQPNSAKLKF